MLNDRHVAYLLRNGRAARKRGWSREKTYAHFNFPHQPQYRAIAMRGYDEGPNTARNAKLLKMVAAGATYAQSARAFGLSGERVRQIVKRLVRAYAERTEHD